MGTRAIANSKLKICLCWMLTEDDSRNDGRKIQYLQDSGKRRKYDPALFYVLPIIIRSGFSVFSENEQGGIR